MNDIVFLRITYSNALSLHRITTTIESVEGLRISNLNFVGTGNLFVGVVTLTTSEKTNIPSLIHKIRTEKDVKKVEKVTGNVLTYTALHH